MTTTITTTILLLPLSWAGSVELVEGGMAGGGVVGSAPVWRGWEVVLLFIIVVFLLWLLLGCILFN